MKRAILCLSVLFFLQGDLPVQADQAPEDVLKAVVKIKAFVPAEAHTAASLGPVREGHGVLIDSNGLIVTTGYLIVESETIEVTGPEGQTVSGRFVGYDHTTGLGLLRADQPMRAVPMKLGESSQVKEGDPVIVAGHGGAESAIGARVITRREFTGYWEYILEEAIYTSPPYAEFGGAALIGADGRLLGIGSLLTQLPFPGLGSLLCNVFIPIDLLPPILNDMISLGRPSRPARPWLGINTEELHGRVCVVRVTAGGPGEEAGFQPGDFILKVNGKVVEGLSDFYRKVWALGPAGTPMTLSVLKGAEIRDIRVRSGDRNKFLQARPRKTI